MKIDQKDKWNKIREKGKLRFILEGILFYGLGAMFVSILIDYGFEFFLKNRPNYLHTSENFAFKLILRLLVFFLAGFFISRIAWNKDEQEFFQNPEEK
jgi:hypothetical protein